MQESEFKEETVYIVMNGCDWWQVCATKVLADEFAAKQSWPGCYYVEKETIVTGKK